MKRVLGVGFISLGLLLLAPTEAVAGGVRLDWNREFYVPGDQVVGSSRVNLDAVSKGVDWEGDGPYFVYLIPPDQDHAGELKEVPGAIPVGRLRIERDKPGSPLAHVRLEFVMPEIPSGNYSVSQCNDPCTHTLIGDLMSSTINVVEDHSEARMMGVFLRLSDRVARLNARARAAPRAEKQVAELDLELQDRYDRIMGKIELLGRRVDQLANDDDPPAATQGALAIGAFLALLAAGVLGLVGFAGISRRAEAPLNRE